MERENLPATMSSGQLLGRREKTLIIKHEISAILVSMETDGAK